MKKNLLFVVTLLILTSLACGQLVVPLQEMGVGSGPAGGADAPQQEAQ